MSARDDLALARQRPAATVFTLALAAALGALLGGTGRSGWSLLAEVVVGGLIGGWLAWIAFSPDLLAQRKNAKEQGARQ